MTGLRRLDPAAGREPSGEEWIRSEARIERIIGGEGEAAAVRERRSVRRRIGVVVTAAVVAVGLVVVGLVPGATDEAFARWTPDPDVLPGELAMPQVLACAKSLGAELTPEDVVLVERRGIASILVLREGGGYAECMVVGERVFNWQGLYDREPEALTGAEATVETMSSSGEGDEQYSRIVGRVGPEVLAVDVRMGDGRVVRAGSAGQWWTAWWPGPEGGEVGGTTLVLHTASGATEHEPGDLWPG
ncbi:MULTISPECIES: hypothetical protein [Actinosynnema]|uniref:hypothetical protein n=1 Tax=Actinosynnema TaxID=40566 RepID=UPI0020A4A83A|nr:hypothetical protein [Actinosynnema pretiosum]MCP2092174.1 hypothetical protein [Actinosynnema pretiosum]